MPKTSEKLIYETITVSPDHKHRLKKIAAELNESQKKITEAWIDQTWKKMFPDRD